mmetsp:Transcript_108546/g.183943  ORF Transcript_108546/g.183943 Transcript_108546/m.183943 type:complete len:108 (+) Transcript_108546:347-670(+)
MQSVYVSVVATCSSRIAIFMQAAQTPETRWLTTEMNANTQSQEKNLLPTAHVTTSLTATEPLTARIFSKGLEGWKDYLGLRAAAPAAAAFRVAAPCVLDIAADFLAA